MTKYELRRVPKVEEYEAALRLADQQLTDEDLGLLHAQAADSRGWTAGDVGAHYGSASYRTGNYRYGRIGRILDECLGGDVAGSDPKNGRRFYWSVIATGETNAEGLWEWTMRPELRRAVNRQP